MATILILDDRATNRNIYARLAAAIEDGVSAEVFADPADALEWLEHNRVDLVITDYKMPGMDGAEFTRRFRTMPNNRHVPVVVITAYDDRSFRLRALDAGATDFLQSPVDHFEIVVRARNLLALNRRMSAGATAAGPAVAVGPEAAGQQAAPPAAEPAAAARVADHAAAAAADLRRILDAVPAMISATDREGRCVYANAAFTAASADAAGPQTGGGRGRWRDLAVLQGGRPVAPYREDAPGKAGRRMLTSKVPLRDGTGEVVAVLTTSFELPGDAAEETAPAAPSAG
jgi:CheY-like chemotaxis protein